MWVWVREMSRVQLAGTIQREGGGEIGEANQNRW